MFDPLFQLLAGALEWFYSLVPNYAFAIAGLTFVVLALFWPLTMKSTRSMMEMRRLQPLIKAAQEKHAGDREATNAAVMSLYSEHGVNPMAGCLPILAQMPVFIVLFRVVRDITRRFDSVGYAAGQIAGAAQAQLKGSQGFLAPSQIPEQTFNPGWLDKGSAIYQSLIGKTEMRSFGIDLARTPLEALNVGITSALPYMAMVVLVAGLSLFQQHQMTSRTANDESASETTSQQQMLMRIMPWMTPFFSLSLPAGVVVYFIVSSMFRIVQQAYITRTIYRDDALMKPLEVPEGNKGSEAKKSEAKSGGEAEEKTADSTKTTSKKKSNSKGNGGNSKHGSRRPNVSAKRVSKRISSKRVQDGGKKRSSRTRVSGWDRAKRTRNDKNN